MQLDKYKGVIKMVIGKYHGADPAFIADEICKSIEIAQAIAGEVPNVSIETRPLQVSTDRKEQLKFEGELRANDPNALMRAPRGPVLVSAAPPVAGAGDEGDDPVEDDIDYYESKPGKGDGANRLQVKLQNMLPASIQVQIPGIAEPLTLVRGIGSPGIKFCHINYSLSGDTTLGCRVTVMTSQKDIDPDAIMNDIVTQAGAIFSAEKRVIVPHVAKPEPPPSAADLEAIMARDRARLNPHNPLASLSAEEARLAAEDAKDFASGRAANPRWQ